MDDLYRHRTGSRRYASRLRVFVITSLAAGLLLIHLALSSVLGGTATAVDRLHVRDGASGGDFDTFSLPDKHYLSGENSTSILFPDDIVKEVQRIELRSVTSTQGLVLVGIFCRAEDFIERDLHRGTSHRLAPRGVTLRFVICHNSQDLAKGKQPALHDEALLHGDLLLLECEENMDSGKSPLYFRTVARRYPNYHFYAKADIDTYNLYFNLALALDAAPKCGLYMGQYWNYITEYNVGHLYILSKDLVAVLQNCQHNCPDPNNYEDLVIGLYVNRFANDRIQWGSWGLRHVVYGADGTMLGDPQRRGGPPLRKFFTPWLILAHGIKAQYWLDATRNFRDVLSVDTIRASAQENFVDGKTTRYWDMNCEQHS